MSAEGRRDEIQEGTLQDERDLLVRQLVRKFKSISDVYRQKIENADSNNLLLWGEQILDAKEIEEVFI